MAAKESTTKESQEPKTLGMHERFVGIMKFVPGGALLFAVIPLVVLGYVAWRFYAAERLDLALYSVQLEQLKVTPQPDWIKTNVVQEVFQNNRLDRLSLLDPRTNATIAQAFETHSWVKATTRVTKSADGHVAVDLMYRQPLAMVYCEPQNADENQVKLTRPGFVPVDADAVVLPVGDFDKNQVYDYVLIMAEGARPAGDIGMPFGDVRIVDALKLCELFGSARQELGIQRIYVESNIRSGGPSPWEFRLTTSDDLQIRWGHAPGAESPGEASADAKASKLTAWLDQQRQMRKTNQSIDLFSSEPAAQVNYSR